MLHIKAREDIIAAVLRAYAKHDETNAFGDSDLDDEQPIAITVRTTLGVLRTLDRWKDKIT